MTCLTAKKLEFLLSKKNGWCLKGEHAVFVCVCVCVSADFLHLTLAASELAYSFGMNKTGLALNALGDALSGGSFLRKAVRLRKPNNAQFVRAVPKETLEETSESAEEILRNAEKVEICWSSTDTEGEGESEGLL
jgi:hypothetical protein